MPGRREPDPKVMGFLQHLEELRGVILSSALAIVLSTAVLWFLSGRILDHVVADTVGRVQFLRPTEAFSARFKVALFLGLLVSFPYVAFRVWSFVGPGLFRSERAIVLPAALSSTALFAGGMAFSYFALTPIMLDLLIGFGTEHVTPNIAVGYLLGFLFKMALACGLLFQLPLVVAVLTRVGLVTPGFLIRKWRHAVLIIFVVSAVVTPGDGPSQIVLATPVVVLYFASIAVSRAIVGRRRPVPAPQAEAGAGPAADPADGRDHGEE